MRSDLTLVITKSQWFWQQEKRLCSEQGTAAQNCGDSQIQVYLYYVKPSLKPPMSLIPCGMWICISYRRTRIILNIPLRMSS